MYSSKKSKDRKERKKIIDHEKQKILLNELYNLNPLSVFGETWDDLNLEIEKNYKTWIRGAIK